MTNVVKIYSKFPIEDKPVEFTDVTKIEITKIDEATLKSQVYSIMVSWRNNGINLAITPPNSTDSVVIVPQKERRFRGTDIETTYLDIYNFDLRHCGKLREVL